MVKSDENLKVVSLFQEIKDLIIQSRKNVVVSINSELSFLYWQIGKKLKTGILNNQRAEYGQKVIDELAKELTFEYGRGWSEKQLRHCIRTAERIIMDAHKTILELHNTSQNYHQKKSCKRNYINQYN